MQGDRESGKRRLLRNGPGLADRLDFQQAEVEVKVERRSDTFFSALT